MFPAHRLASFLLSFSQVATAAQLSSDGMAGMADGVISIDDSPPSSPVVPVRPSRGSRPSVLVIGLKIHLGVSKTVIKKHMREIQSEYEVCCLSLPLSPAFRIPICKVRGGRAENRCLQPSIVVGEDGRQSPAATLGPVVGRARGCVCFKELVVVSPARRWMARVPLPARKCCHGGKKSNSRSQSLRLNRAPRPNLLPLRCRTGGAPTRRRRLGRVPQSVAVRRDSTDARSSWAKLISDA